MGGRAVGLWALLIAAAAAGAFVVAGWPGDEAAEVAPADAVETAEVSATAATDGARPGAVVARAAAPAADAEEAPGAVRLRVVRAPDGAPVPGIPVFLHRAVAPRGPFHLLVWTDERGQARFPEVWAGTGLRLRVQAGAGPRVERDDVVVTAGRETDLGDVRLAPLGLVDALIVDPTGKPLEDVRLVATLDPATVASLDTDAFPLAAEPPVPVAAGRTDNHGRVRLEGVPPGIVGLRATKPPWRGATERARVPAAGADSAVVTIVLRSAATAGLIVHVDGRPAAGLAVGFGDDGLDGFVARATTTTDEEGAAALGGFAGFVRFDAELTVPGRGAFLVCDLGVGISETVTFADAGRYGVLVVDEEGAPVRGARVGARSTARRTTLAPSGGRRPKSRGPTPGLAVVEVVGVTGADGRVTLDTGEPPAGIWVVHPDYLVHGEPPALRGRDARARNRAADGPSSVAPRVVLVRGVTIAGRVLGPDDQAVAGADVRILGDGPDGVRTTRSDDRGRYELASVRPERVRAIVATTSSPPLAGRVHVRRLPSTSASDAVDVHLERLSRILGRVTDAAGERVEGARVTLEGTEYEAWTDARGEFVLGPMEFVDRDRPRTPVLVAVRFGYGAGRVRERWPEAGRDLTGVTLSVGETKDVEGYVQDRDRRAVPFPIVELVDPSDPDGAPVSRIVSADEFGRFVFRDVLAGKYLVRARARELYGIARDPVEVSPDPRIDPKVVPIFVQPSGVFRAVVLLGRDEAPLSGVLVRCTQMLRNDGPLSFRWLHDSARSDAEGRVVFPAFSSFGYLEASAPDPYDSTRTIDARTDVSAGRDRVELLELR